MSKLPPAPQLARECAGRTYAEVGRRYGVTREAVRLALKTYGLWQPRRRTTVGRDLRKQTSTALALIGQGVTTYHDLAQALGYQSRSGVYYFIATLINQGLVVKDDLGQLSLTIAGEQYHPVPVTIVRQRPDGVYEPITT